MYGLPCKHLLLQRIKEDRYPLLCLDDFPSRWIHSFDSQSIQVTSIITTVVKQTPPTDYSYNGCIARFEKYISNAHRSQEIHEVLDNCISQLTSVEHQAGSDSETELKPPTTVSLSGRPFAHPRNNTEFKKVVHQRKKENTIVVSAVLILTQLQDVH